MTPAENNLFPSQQFGSNESTLMERFLRGEKQVMSTNDGD